MNILIITLCYTSLVKGCFYFPPLSDYKRLNLLGNKFVYEDYWDLPKIDFEEAKEEAVMLIGGTLDRKEIEQAFSLVLF